MDLFHTIETTGRLYRNVYVIGDVHGCREGLEAILRHAGLIRRDGQWSGGRAHVVQCGDIVDRGPDSEGCLKLLLRLRRQARQAGGHVDLLVGNHELALARGDHSISDVSDPVALGEQLARAIRSGRLHAARAYRHYLMTHAGVSPALMKMLIAKMKEQPRKRITVASLARYLNQQLKAAFRRDDFSHPMFHVGWSRGGEHDSGGIFWADFDADHQSKTRHPRIWQVFGHTPPGGDRVFRVTPDERRVNIDVGISTHYGGYRAYAKLLPDSIIGVHCHNSDFKEEVLSTLDSQPLATSRQQTAGSR